MKAELKRLHSPDIDLGTFSPDEPMHFGFLLQAMVGPVGEASEESFDIMVCTPDWIQSTYSPRGPLWGRHFLIVFVFDLPSIRKTISSYVDSCEGENWSVIAKQLSRIGRWEFEDYKHNAELS